MSLLRPTLPQRRNERYRRLLVADNWELGSGAQLKLFYDFTTTASLEAVRRPATGEAAGPTLPIVRTTTARFLDWESKLRTVRAGETGCSGCRRVENLMSRATHVTTAWHLSGTGAGA